MKKILAVGTILSLAMIAVPAVSSADTTASSTVSAQVQSMLTQIQTLQAQLKTLQDLQSQVKTAQTNVSSTLKLIRNLKVGMSGADISTLQTILASDPSVYPQGIVSGYFGNLTAEAVKKFQKKYGIEALGTVGPKTLKKLNEHINELGLKEEDRDDDEGTVSMAVARPNGKKLCVKVAPGHLIAEGWLKKNTAPIVPECQTVPQGIQKQLTGSTTPPVAADTVAPVISGLGTYNLASTTTNLVWSTNESSTGKVWFGTANPVNLASASLVSDQTSTLSHTVSLSGLATSTPYYYLVVAVDGSGNVATSSQGTFTTLAQ